MANVLVNEDSMTAIADAIRTKSGSQDTYKPAQMADAIINIPTQGVTPTGTKQISITENGTTTENVSAYANAEITVNVQGSGMDWLQYARKLTGFFQISYETTYTFPMDTIVINAPLVWELPNFFSTGAFSAASQKARGVKKITLNIDTFSGAGCFNGAKDLEEIEINASNSNNYTQDGTSGAGAFTYLPALKKITGVTFNGNSARWSSNSQSNTLWLPTGSNLEEIRFVPNSMTYNGQYMLLHHGKLSDASLASIANAMAENTSKAIRLHADVIARLPNIMGTVADGTFTLDTNGTVTLQDFITNTKGWTVS